MCQFDIGIQKEHIRSIGEGCTVIAAVGWHSATNNSDFQTAAETKDDVGSTVSRVGVSDQHLRTRHLRVVLLRQRSQQTRNQFRLVLGWNHYRQLGSGI